MSDDSWIGWYSAVCIHVYFDRLISEKHGEALLSVAITEHVFRFMVKSEEENDMETKFLITSNGGSSLYGHEELSW
jgi:hypothetical protein